jgi:hypothetical protein
MIAGDEPQAHCQSRNTHFAKPETAACDNS